MKHNEMEMTSGDTTFRVRYDVDMGEDQWFDARAGVGSPGYPPSVEVTEVNFGNGWESPEVYPQLNPDAIADEIMDILTEIQGVANAEAAEAEYQAWQDAKKYEGWDK